MRATTVLAIVAIVVALGAVTSFIPANSVAQGNLKKDNPHQIFTLGEPPHPHPVPPPDRDNSDKACRPATHC